MTKSKNSEAQVLTGKQGYALGLSEASSEMASTTMKFTGCAVVPAMLAFLTNTPEAIPMTSSVVMGGAMALSTVFLQGAFLSPSYETVSEAEKIASLKNDRKPAMSEVFGKTVAVVLPVIAGVGMGITVYHESVDMVQSRLAHKEHAQVSRSPADQKVIAEVEGIKSQGFIVPQIS